MARKKIIYIVAGVVLLAVILYFAFGRKTENSANEQNKNTTTTTGAVTSSQTVSPAVKKSSAPTKTEAPLSATQRYLDAIKIYKNTGYYFQFVDCHGAPGSLVMKKGKKFMLDNRDDRTRKIAIVGGQSFQISAYNFAIATAPSALGLHYITCDGGGAASILVQP